ncbi:MAG: hypothetical protein ACYC75_00505 [Minisyncoccota bacterium]
MGRFEQRVIKEVPMMKTPVKTFVTYLNGLDKEKCEFWPFDLVAELRIELGNRITTTNDENRSFCWEVVGVMQVYMEFGDDKANDLQLQFIPPTLSSVPTPLN